MRVARRRRARRSSGWTTTRPAHPIGLAVEGGDGWRGTNDFSVTWQNPDQGSGSPIAAAYYKIGSAPETPTDGTRVSGVGLTQITGLRVPRDGDWTIYVWLARRGRQRRPRATPQPRSSASTPPPPRSPSSTSAARRRRSASRPPTSTAASPAASSRSASAASPTGARSRRAARAPTSSPPSPTTSSSAAPTSSRPPRPTPSATAPPRACARTGARWSSTCRCAATPPSARHSPAAPKVPAAPGRGSGSGTASGRGSAACCARAARCCPTRASRSRRGGSPAATGSR